MDNATRWRIEEAHDKAMRQLNQAQEVLADYQRQLTQTTSQLVDYVYSFYRELDEGIPYGLSAPFEEVVAKYNFEIRRKSDAIDEKRMQEQRTFRQKMDV